MIDMEESINNFFLKLDVILYYISFLLAGLSCISLLIFFIRKISIKNLKKKYDFIQHNEIKTLWYFSLGILISIVIFPRQIVSDKIFFRHFIDLFIEISMGLIFGSFIYYTLKFYYPTYLSKQLKRLRYKPRISPDSGKPMKLLTEEEEDVYLDEGMQKEEEVFSVDYDVWIDEDTGYTQIEKYSGKSIVTKCPHCGYHTLQVVKEELLIAPTTHSSGELLKKSKCNYCGHMEKEIFTVAKIYEEK